MKSSSRRCSQEGRQVGEREEEEERDSRSAKGLSIRRFKKERERERARDAFAHLFQPETGWVQRRIEAKECSYRDSDICPRMMVKYPVLMSTPVPFFPT